MAAPNTGRFSHEQDDLEVRAVSRRQKKKKNWQFSKTETALRLMLLVITEGGYRDLLLHRPSAREARCGRGLLFLGDSGVHAVTS